LKRLLPAVEADHDLVGLSGTSGGALCAVTAWYGLLTGGPEQAAELLDAVWDDVATDSWRAQLTNTWLGWYTRLEKSGAPVPQVSPSRIPGRPAQRWFRRLVERHIRFDQFDDLVTDTSPTVTIATVNVNSGAFERYSDSNITSERMVASAAVPHLFVPVELDGDWHWDGLLSQNPPVRQFLTDDGPKPDELWVIQINPQTREDRPTSLGEIADRRNELAGNLSLNQELHFIEAVNDWIEAGHLPDDYKYVEVRCLTLDRELDYASKFERDPDFIRELREYGEAQTDKFLAGELDDACPAMRDEDAEPG
jgi:NTE family protein